MACNTKKIVAYLIIGALIMIAALCFDNKKQMSPVFTVPFFSGAANFTSVAEWKYAPAEVAIYRNKTTEIKEKYKFQKFADKDLIIYNHYNNGYLLIILLAKSIFFWAGDVHATELLQVLTHIIFSIFIINSIHGYIGKGIFIILYSLNPLVIYFVTFPFLYFWQVVPAFGFIYLYLNKFKVKIYEASLISLLMGLSFITRPTVILLILFVSGLLFLYSSAKTAIISCLILISFTIFFYRKAENKSPWHTIYVGIGGYPNPFVKTLSDTEGFAIYNKHTGEVLNISTGGNFYNLNVFKKYDLLLQEEYFQIVKTKPLMLVKNAVLNFFQSFSLGYFVDYPLWVNYLSSLAGFIFFMLLFLKKHFLWIMAIAFNSLTFTPYFPPIQAYMFGGYILIICAFIQLLNDFGIIRKLDSWIQNSKIYPMLPFA